MNINGKQTKKQATTNNSSKNIFEQEELVRKVKELEAGMKASTWRDLETRGRFTKNDKLTFISDDMLILGCDIGSETHYIRAIDARGRELSNKAFSFHNSAEGFQSAREWAVDIAARHNKKQIVLGLEPTGHYWFCIAAWMISHDISVVQVNPYAVKQTKEVEDNSQNKDDRKDPKLIANLVKDGNYGMPYLPENLYAELRNLSRMRDRLMEDRIRLINRIHGEMSTFFPEYKEAFGKLDGTFTLAVLSEAPFPEDILKLGTDGLKEIWRKAGLRGCGYNRADKITMLAEKSVGIKHGTSGGKRSVTFFTKQLLDLTAEMKDVEEELRNKCSDIPNAENILEIKGIGNGILSGILAEIGDHSRFDCTKEIQKMCGLHIVGCSSGKHKGETRISHRGRKRLRYWLYQAAKSAVTHADEFKQLHEYYTTRPNNPLKKMQSLIVIACKILRVIFTLLSTGRKYDPGRMLRDIRYPAPAKSPAV